MFRRKFKVAKNDFKVEDLPSNRKEVFFDLFKNRFGLFFKNGVILFVFSIPILILIFGHQLVLSQLYHQFIELKLPEEEYLALVNGYRNVRNILLVFGFLIFATGLAGLIRIVKMMIWYEPIFYSSDFLIGIKQNFKHLTIAAILFGIFNVILGYIEGITMEGSELYGWFLNAISLGMMVILVIPIIFLIIAEVSVYVNRFANHLLNAAIIYFKSFLRTIGMILILLVPFVLLLINHFFIQLILFIALIILYLPIFVVIWQLYSYRLFDIYINKNSYPELIDRGIVRKELTEDVENRN